jgi:hypothetical protein
MSVLDDARDCIRFGVKSPDFVGYPILSRTEFQQPGQHQKAITPKLLIVSRCANKRWKDEKLPYISSVELQVKFWLQGYRNLKIVNSVQLGQIQFLLRFTLELSPLPLLKFGLLLRVDF